MCRANGKGPEMIDWVSIGCCFTVRGVNTGSEYSNYSVLAGAAPGASRGIQENLSQGFEVFHLLNFLPGRT